VVAEQIRWRGKRDINRERVITGIEKE